VARFGLAMVAVGGGHGTLTEVGFALGMDRPVIGLGTWTVHGVHAVDTPGAAVSAVTRLLS
jgi:predicted polyphosphate/ATP-dependent NAD kinase